MKTKADIQREIDDLQRQTDALAKRRETMRADRDKITASIEAQTKAIGAALLDNRDATKESDVLTRDRVKLEGIEEAITQADRRLAELKQAQEEARRSYAMVDFTRLADEADALFITAVDKMRDTFADLTAIEAKFAEIHQISPAAGQNVDYHDHLKYVRDFSRNWREGLAPKVRMTEEQAAERVIAEARAQKGK